ncbi:unknown [Clostridium sp. CAG:343]|nr:unknown [Clostridium sp. CAG:343]
MKKLYFEGMMQMEERSLRITGADKTFFTKITNALTKMLIPTKIGINGMLISIKRNNLLKAFEIYNAENENYNKDELEKKYDTAYEAYLDSLDKYVMDSIYKKVRNGTASEFEKNAISKYYEVTSLKEKEYMEYKYRKQKYLIELDYEGIKIGTKEKLIERYNQFYISKMDSLYKSILKNYSIKVADNTNIYDSTKEWIYTKIFYTLEEYIENILSLKIKIDYDQNLKNIISEYEKYESYMVGKLDTRDNIEKNMVLLGLSRKLFTHSLPLIVAEQCYEKLLKDARSLVQDTKIATKREKAYAMLINLIEDYNIKLLSTKVYWESPKDREEYKKFWNRYQEISKLKETDFIEYIKQKEILFIKNDMKKLDKGKTDYTKLLKYFKRKLVDYGAIREIKNSYKSEGKYIKVKEVV